LALNGGIRWVSLNEREKAVNERGERRIRGGKKNTRRGTFGILGREHHLEGEEDLYCCFGAGVACWRMVLVFS
jgi:hypothetical protein